MTTPKLVLPDIKYQKSYLEAVREYQLEKQLNYINLNLTVLENDFSTYVQSILNESKGIDLPDGYVPHTVYWLVEGTTFLGRVNIRHELNEFLRTEGGHIGYDIRPSQRQKGYGSLALKLAIEQARKLGISEVLVTCDVGNIASNKIIQKNGGMLRETKKISENKIKNHYRINSHQ